MYENQIEEIRARKPKIAICYDFDKTLSPDDMQTFTLIPSFGLDKDSFWKESNNLAKENLMDNNLAWMYKLLSYSQLKRLPIKRDYFNQIGADIPLYKGVETWFERINQYASKKGIEVEHYIISSGLKEIIEGSSIAQHFKRIYASSYLYTTDGVAEWPAQAVNYTTKTQFIFRIAKGIFDECDERVNDSMLDAQLRIPYENIIYIGDSATDIPSMRLVESKGGYSIGVYDPSSDNRKKVYDLYNDKRISFYTPADYSARSELSKFMKQIIDEISARETIRTEQKILDIPVSLYKMLKFSEFMLNSSPEDVSPRDRKRLATEMDALKELIEGNIE